MQLIFGFLLAGLGVLFVLKTEWFLENFGTIAWAEEHLGLNGGSRLMYKLIGIGFIFIGFLLISGLYSGFLFGTVGKVFIRN
jgi:hypothetical protein